MTDSKKKFRVVGIPYAKSVINYAKKLEDTMNELSEDGYSFQITEQKNGTVVIGQLAELAKHPLQRLLEAREKAQQEDNELYSPRTKELLGRISRLPGNGQDVEALAKGLKENLSAITRGFGAEELSVAAREIEAAAEAHVQHPGHDEDCPYDKALRIVAENLRSVIQTQLQ